MAAFDFKLWKRRALSRCRNAKRRGDRDHEARYNEDIRHMRMIESLLSWCDSRRIKVDFVKRMNSIFDPVSRKIEVSSRMNPETQLFYILHECGHFLIHNPYVHKRYAKSNDESQTRTFMYRCNVLEEEYEAWHRGHELADRLAFKLDEARFDEVKGNGLRSYMKWAMKLGWNLIKE